MRRSIGYRCAMSSGRFCYLCGAVTEELFHGLCSPCFLGEKELASIPPRISVSLCRGCFRYYSSGSWVDGGESLTGFVETVGRKEALSHVSKELKDPSVDVEIKDIKEKGKGLSVELELHVSGTTSGLEYRQTLNTVLQIKNVTCPDCSRRSGGYYEAIVQLRSEQLDDTVTKFHEQIGRLYARDKQAFIVGETLVKGGVDFKLGSAKAAKTVATYFKSHYKAVIKETASLVGRKEGNDIYRITVLIRI
ncbi:MAG TPA: hypothetical protein ENH13_05490 [Euryarchaeota archaeon]|nr:NMD3 family protein [archaeon BMS3Bbin16]HDH28568.1 hypothetical protein [Euryarchaeota archaeon]